MISAYAYRPEWYTDMINDPEGYRTEPFCILGNLYFAGNKDSATHIVDTGEGLILFDTGYPNMQKLLLDSVCALGFSVKDIKMIFHTHAHFDHFGATQKLKKESGATCLISRADAPYITERSELCLCHYMPGIKTDFFEPDRTLEDGEVITLGDTKITCLLTPGHTPGTMSYEITVKDGMDEYTALLCGGVGFNTLNRTFIEEYGLNLRPDFENSLKKWETLKPDIFLGNHTQQSRTLERRAEGRSFVDREAWPEYITEIEQKYDRMLKEEG